MEDVSEGNFSSTESVMENMLKYHQIWEKDYRFKGNDCFFYKSKKIEVTGEEKAVGKAP